MKNKKNGPIEKKRVEVQQFHISCSAPVPYEGSGEKVPHLVAAYFMKKMRANEGYSISIHKIQEKNEIPLSKKKICVHVELE